MTPSLHTLGARAIRDAIAARKLSSEEVVRALLSRIDEREGAVNAFTDVLAESALAAAKAADAKVAKGDAIGALHGVPISVKESIELEGFASTLGIPQRKGALAKRDAPIVSAHKAAGAVVIGRTNVAQLLLSFESRNPVYGQTANPRALTHSPGGSSGGEAAAVAYGGSCLGIGTDIGGSIRIPAHFSGVVGFKPTQDRWPNRGLVTALVGQEAIRSQCGPLARSVDDCVLAMEAMDPWAMATMDGRVAPLPWLGIESVLPKKVRVGVLGDDGVLTPSKAITRAVDRAAEVLRERGCEVRAWALPEVPPAIVMYLSALGADGAKTARAAMGDAPVDVTLKSLLSVSKLPESVREAARSIAKITGQTGLGRMLAALGERSVARYWAIIGALRAYRFAVEDAMARDGIDVLIAPPFATPSVPHGFGAQFALAASYTMLWNLVPFPAGVVPVTSVRSDETQRKSSIDRVVARAVQVDARSLGLPIGVQVIARPWRDEQCLAAMRWIEEATLGDEGRPTPVA